MPARAPQAAGRFREELVSSPSASSPKFARVDLERVVPYPDGSPGFYFARL